MTDTAIDLLATGDLDEATARAMLGEALTGADDGELFLEYRQTEGLVFDNGRLKAANYDTSQGFGLRAVAGEAAGYAHSGEISQAALARAADAVRAVASGHSGSYAAAPQRTNARLYSDVNPLAEPAFADKVALMQTVDAYARAKDPKVRQVSVSLASSWQVVDILRADGHRVRDIRPLVRFNVSVVAGDGMGPYVTTCVDELKGHLSRVCENPSNPSFNHYMFEAIAALVRSLCTTSAQAVDAFEAMLFPPFQYVLQKDVSEFTPYVFQILAQLLECRPGLSAAYMSLLPPILAPTMWERPANTPALVRLVCAYIQVGKDAVAPQLDKVRPWPSRDRCYQAPSHGRPGFCTPPSHPADERAS